MKIVTGYTGEPHITSNDNQALNQGMFGSGDYLLDVGQKFNATLSNATTVVIEDGEGVMQGVHFRIEPGTTESVTISSGTTGYNRIDLICAKYTKDTVTGVEDVSLVVLEGTPSASTPSVPTFTNGDILAGDVLAYAPLWKVTLTGLTPALTQAYQDRIQNIDYQIDISDSQSQSGDIYTWVRDDTLTLQAGTYILSADCDLYDYNYGTFFDIKISCPNWQAVRSCRYVTNIRDIRYPLSLFRVINVDADTTFTFEAKVRSYDVPASAQVTAHFSACRI